MIDYNAYNKAREVFKAEVYKDLRKVGIPDHSLKQIAHGMAYAYIYEVADAACFWDDLYLDEIHAWAFYGDDDEFIREFDDYQYKKSQEYEGDEE